jgi:S1-C subfamily serine protease
LKENKMSEHNALMELSEAMAAAVAKAAAATVLVDGRERMPASGISLRTDMLLTANHVVERDEEIRVVLPDGSEYEAQIAGRDHGTDIAVLRLPEAALVTVDQAAQPAQVGQIALALGRPTKEGIQASLGIVSAVAGPAHTGHGRLLENHIRTDAIPYPGFSGGPLINAAGEILGMNTSGLARGASLAIPVDIAWQVAEALAEHGSIRRGYLGIRSQLVELSGAMQNALGRKQGTGLLVMGVEPDSPAEQGGLQVGDIVVGLHGEPVAEHDQLVARLVGDLVGQAAVVQVLRGGQPADVTVVIGEMQPEQQGQFRRRSGRRRR